MAKQKQMEGDGFPEPLPAEVQDAADKYQAASLAASKARGKLNTARDNCIAAMEQHNIPELTFSDGAKDLVLEHPPKLKFRKRKRPVDDDRDGDE